MAAAVGPPRFPSSHEMANAILKQALPSIRHDRKQQSPLTFEDKFRDDPPLGNIAAAAFGEIASQTAAA